MAGGRYEWRGRGQKGEVELTIMPYYYTYIYIFIHIQYLFSLPEMLVSGIYMLPLTYKHQKGRVWKETFSESILVIPHASQNNVAKLILKLARFETRIDILSIFTLIGSIGILKRAPFWLPRKRGESESGTNDTEPYWAHLSKSTGFRNAIKKRNPVRIHQWSV